MNYVYLLRCSDGTLYCGWTTDLEARLAAHNSGDGAKYTRSRRPVELVYFEEYEERHAALSREWHIKRMRREEKMKLMTGTNKTNRLIREKKNMIKVYCYNRCSTCKKALKWLDEKGIEYETVDIKTDHPDEKTLREYYAMSGLPLKRFFNTSGIPYRAMGLSKKLPDMSEDEQLTLLSTDGMLVKRPLVVGDGFVLTGFKEDEWIGKLSGMKEEV